jgi:hypothetical protein
MYDHPHPAGADDRARIVAESNGNFWYRGVLPVAYPIVSSSWVPDDDINLTFYSPMTDLAEICYARLVSIDWQNNIHSLVKLSLSQADTPTARPTCIFASPPRDTTPLPPRSTRRIALSLALTLFLLLGSHSSATSNRRTTWINGRLGAGMSTMSRRGVVKFGSGGIALCWLQRRRSGRKKRSEAARMCQ